MAGYPSDASRKGSDLVPRLNNMHVAAGRRALEGPSLTDVQRQAGGIREDQGGDSIQGWVWVGVSF